MGKAVYLAKDIKLEVKRSAFLRCPEDNCNVLEHSGREGYNKLIKHIKNAHRIDTPFINSESKALAIAFLEGKDWIGMNQPDNADRDRSDSLRKMKVK